MVWVFFHIDLVLKNYLYNKQSTHISIDSHSFCSRGKPSLFENGLWREVGLDEADFFVFSK